MNSLNKQKGLTLIEATVVVAIVAILAAVTFPSVKESRDRGRLKSAVEAHMSQLYLAKSEAVLKNQKVFYSFRADRQCYGFRTGQPCDCAQLDPTAPDMCTLARTDVSSADAGFTSTITTAGTEAFEPVRGTASGVGQLTWTSLSGHVLKTSISSVGRISVCSPSGVGNVAGYTSTSC